MDIPEIDPDTAAARLAAGSSLFMDVRDPGSFNSSHIPGAVHVTDASIGAFLESTPKDRSIVVYCYHGNSSLGGAGYLIEHGFQDVCSMSGGFEAWRGRHPEEPGGAA